MSEGGRAVRELALDGGKSLPVVGYLTASMSGWTLAEWASFLAILYTGVLLAEKGWKCARWAARRLAARRSGEGT